MLFTTCVHSFQDFPWSNKQSIGNFRLSNTAKIRDFVNLKAKSSVPLQYLLIYVNIEIGHLKAVYLKITFSAKSFMPCSHKLANIRTYLCLYKLEFPSSYLRNIFSLKKLFPEQLVLGQPAPPCGNKCIHYGYGKRTRNPSLLVNKVNSAFVQKSWQEASESPVDDE